MDLTYVKGRLHQVALVVPDLEASMLAYWERLGVGPWAIFTFDPTRVREMTFRGRQQGYSMRIAFAMWGETQLELIQPLQGPSLYHEYLEANPAGGLHHVAVLVPDLAAAIAELEAKGYPLVQSGLGTGLAGDGGYAYFETPTGVTALLELIELPVERRAPDAFFPADAAAEALRAAAPSRGT